jgi:D-alanyl-D-alanine carboxypeptidase
VPTDSETSRLHWVSIVLTDLRRVASLVSIIAETIVVAVAALAIGMGAANARGYHPPHSAIVMDVKAGRVLYSQDADAPRFPASLTKMMTLYLLFDALKSGRVSMSTPIPVSAHAAGMPPTKIGFRPGDTITVDAAIRSIVTQSANDVATAIGEYLGGGSEVRFAEMMTAKARELGMRDTHFENASGLPNPRQHSSAHDMALLGIALFDRFPGYYHYFSTQSFTYNGRRMRNHNHLLGRISGVDGIKTGFTTASGFNLVASAAQGKRRIIAVVMGGPSVRIRDAQVAGLINKYLPRAASRDEGAELVARTPSVAVAPIKADVPASVEAPIPSAPSALAYTDETAPAPRPSPIAATPRNVDPVTTASNRPEGWMIQIGSAPSASSAHDLLEKAKERAGRVLASAEPYTETFQKGSNVYHRARFTGFASQAAASKACSVLKKKDFGCFTLAP